MKNVVLGSTFVLLASAVTGCVTSNSGDDTTGGDVLTTMLPKNEEAGPEQTDVKVN